MTRTTSAEQIKRGTAAKGDGKPRPGTQLREAYDAFRRGEAIKHSHGFIERLRNDYGMEFERLPNHGGMRLVGEWDGPYFVPLERILQDD